jgi:hypothetical protein
MKIVSILRNLYPSVIEDLYWPPAVSAIGSNLGISEKKSRRALIILISLLPNLIIIGIGIGIIALSIMLFLKSDIRKSWAAFAAIALLGPVIISWLSRRADSLNVYGRRHAKPLADELVSRDQRPPVLILRKFGDDEKLRYTFKTYPWGSFESRLNNKLKVYGPVIHLMNPRDEIPSLEGPSPLPVDYNRWRESVLLALGQARVIVMIAGNSLSLLWELSQITERGLLHRTILLIPPYFGKDAFGALKRSTEFLLFRSRLKNNMYLIESIKALLSAPEFEALKHIDVTDTILIRWTTTGEPVIIKGGPSDFVVTLDAIDLSIEISGLNSVDGEQTEFT